MAGRRMMEPPGIRKENVVVAEWRLRRFLRHNGLGLVLFGLFGVVIAGQALAGLAAHNDELRTHGRQPIGFGAYLTTGHFIEAVFENWESEFLQMGALVVLTIFLRQSGSPESKPLKGKEAQDKDPRAERRRPDAPWPVRRGGLALAIYQHSLSIALFGLFAVSFVFHALGGTAEHNAEAREHGEPTVSVVEFVSGSEFWYQSFQNWQSEFLSAGALVVLAIFLRQRGSAESKAVDEPHRETGTE
jgi:hypothetical protein